MPQVAMSNAWRLTSFVLGVALPGWIWASIAGPLWSEDAFGADSTATAILWRGSSVLAFLEVGCMAWWTLRVRPHSARAERRFSRIFAIGAVLAGGWSLFAMFWWLTLLHEPEVGLLWESPLGVFMLSPFACILIYGVNAGIARRRARAIWDAG